MREHLSSYRETPDVSVKIYDIDTILFRVNNPPDTQPVMLACHKFDGSLNSVNDYSLEYQVDTTYPESKKGYFIGKIDADLVQSSLHKPSLKRVADNVMSGLCATDM